jgi:hypothetical protein
VLGPRASLKLKPVSPGRRVWRAVFRPSPAFLDWARSPEHWSILQFDRFAGPAKRAGDRSRD